MSHRNRVAKLVFAVSAVVLAVFSTMSAQATTVTLHGVTVDFTYDNTQLALFGGTTPHVLAGTDTLEFDPTSFKALASGNVSPVSVSSTLGITVTERGTGSSLSRISLKEVGDYQQIEGVNGTTPDGETSVAPSGQMRIGYGSIILTNSLIEATDTKFALTAVTGASVTHPWEVDSGRSITTGAPSQVLLTIQNVLTATSQATSDSAWIQKKVVDITVVSSVPESESYALALVSLGVIGITARRARKQSDHGE